MRRVWQRLLAMLHRDCLDRELDEDVRAHLELAERDARSAGLSPEDARREALRRFGSIEPMKEAHRDERGVPRLENLVRDVRQGMRGIARNPGVMMVAIATLALGAGANTAIFSVVNTVLLRPLPYPNGDRIVRVVQVRPPAASDTGTPSRLAALSTDDLYAWRDRTETFSQMAGYARQSMTLTGYGDPVRLTAARVSPTLFPLLRVPSLLGRTFERGEDKPGADAEIVLSFTAWQKYFAADPDILTRTLMLDGRGYSVVGVMPRGFQFPDEQTEAWVPFQLAPAQPAPGAVLVQLVPVIARIKDGISLATATSEANVIFRQISEGPSSAMAGGRAGGRRMVQRGKSGSVLGGGALPTIELTRLKDEMVGPVRPALLMMLASVGFVLLIACANVANLLLARAAGRQQEMAVRVALGAGRARLIRQLLTESLVLALLGAALGAVLAWGAIDALRVFGPADIPRLDQLRLDLPFFAFTFAIAVMTGVLFGTMPAMRLSQTAAMSALKRGAAVPASGLGLFRRNRTRSMLAMVEVGLAMVLLVGAGLLVNSFVRLSNVNPGYEPNNVLAFQVPSAEYSAAQRLDFYERMLRRVRALPGVRSAAISSTLPLQQEFMRIGVRIQGRPEPTRPEDAPIADFRSVSPDYFAALGIRIVEGRDLSAEAREDGPRELLVNESFVHRYLSGGRGLGQRLNFMGPAPWEIVGVVNDVRYAGLTAEPFPEIYIDYRQAGARRGVPADMFFAARTMGSPVALMANIRALVKQEDPQLALANVATMEQRLSASVARPRFYAALVGVFALLAVMLAAVGIYGVLSYAVSQSTREIGIRLALGAPRRDVLRLVLWQGCAIAGIGITIGLAGAAALTRSLTTLLFGVRPFDPGTFVGGSVLLAAVALAACYVPARRATSVDPIVALRAE